MPTDIARPEFYQRIDSALMRRQNLASAIEALAAESYSNRMPSDVKALLVCLRGSVFSIATVTVSSWSELPWAL